MVPETEISPDLPPEAREQLEGAAPEEQTEDLGTN
jgi:hypothetical protein